ncbi:hypothetical protein C8A05DRAFT_18009, partial [Staphylotrichum tortipilum]
VGSTVLIPTGSRVQGSSWSQIQGAGFYFSDMQHPKVMVRAGNKGDVGTMEIVEMLFSVRGSTAGAILMEWNTAASEQGAAAMWDSHFRVGGALGSDLDLATCPKFSEKAECIAASLMFHVTPQANGYFENVWAWVADHDNDRSIYNQPDSSIGARGMLIESKGPSWFYGGGSEHLVLYNYLLSGAKSVYMGHIQTESPYFQPMPGAPAPFGAAAAFPNDPDFSGCNYTANTDNEACRYAWGMRIIDSTDVTIHSAGLYSFFNAYYQDCIETKSCQEHMLEVRGSTGVVVYNLFTVATVHMADGVDGSKVLQADGNQRGFTTEVSVWVPVPGADNVDIVWVGTDVWNKPTVSCSKAPCLLIMPTSALDSETTIFPSPYTTSFEYGNVQTTSVNGVATSVFVTSVVVVTIEIPPITTRGMPFSNVNVSTTGAVPITIYPSINIPPIGIPLPDGSGGSTTRPVTLPPWPQVNAGPPIDFTDPRTAPAAVPSGGGTIPRGGPTTYYTPIGVPVTVSSAVVTTVKFPASTAAFTMSSPATTTISFGTPAIAVGTTCRGSGISTFNFACPTARVVTFLGSTAAVVTVDCSLITAWSIPTGSSTTTTTPLPIYGTWPMWGRILPVTTSVDKPQPTDDGVVVPCRAWFFFICISWPEIHIDGWHWILPPGIYGPGPPPINLIKWPPGITISGKLPDWPRITIGRDNQLTTEEKKDCQTQTAKACTTTAFVSGTSTLSSATRCETISGCSISVSASTTISTIDTQTPAPIGTLFPEPRPSGTRGAAYTNSVLSALSVELAHAEALADATTIAYTPGTTAGPSCNPAARTACGGTLCSGYWCTLVPPPGIPPPGFRDPKNPNSRGYSAPETIINPPSATTTTAKPSCPANPPCNCNESGCDSCSPQCCYDGTCPKPTTSQPTATKGSCDGFDCRACGSPFDDACCRSSFCQVRVLVVGGVGRTG